jgi:hypothetical protein
MSDCDCKKTGSHISEWIVGAATGAVVAGLWLGNRPTPAVIHPVGAAGQVPLLDAAIQPYLDRIGDQIGAQIGPILQHDEGFQRRVGTAVGAEIARQYMVPIYVIALAALVAAGAAVYSSMKR